MAWIKVTAPNGDVVQINADELVRIRPAVTGEAAAQAKTLIDLSNGQFQATRESVDQIMKLLAANNK